MNRATFNRPHSFDQAVQYLTEGHPLDYEVKVGDHKGALMTREVWLEEVKTFGFIDDDGHGSQLTKKGKIVGGNCRPSAADELLKTTAYILWYNK